MDLLNHLGIFIGLDGEPAGAANPQETALKAATMEEVVEFLLDVAWKITTSSFQRDLEGWVVLLNQPVK